jgi:hypothetical protein
VGESWLALAWCSQSEWPDDPEQDPTHRSCLGSSGAGIGGGTGMPAHEGLPTSAPEGREQGGDGQDARAYLRDAAPAFAPAAEGADGEA